MDFFYCKRGYFLKHSIEEIVQNINKLESLSFKKKYSWNLSFYHKRLVFSHSLFPNF